MAVFLLRHGETLWNRARRLQGRKDTPLTLKGARQAAAMGRALARELGGAAPAVFFASPLGRARQTAVIVADGIGFDPERILFDERLAETSFGAWDGLNMAEILAGHRAAWERRNEDRWRNAPPGGESHAESAVRAAGFLAGLPAARPLAIVAHGSLNRVMRGLWTGMDGPASLRLDEPQDGFYRLEEDGREVFVPADGA